MTGTGEPTADPLALVLSILTLARRARFKFGRAFALAAEAALSYMPEREARDWWEVLHSTREAWADAYRRRPSRFPDLRD